MSDTSIFEIPQMDVDLKTYVKLRCKACLGDSVIFKFLVYNESSPVDLSQYKCEFRARLSKSGNVYSETDNITMSGNELTVICDNVLTSEIGEQVITLRLFDITNYKQKSNYIIILKVMSTIDADEEIQTTATLSALGSLDIGINRYLELKIDLLDAIDDANTALTNLNTATNTANTTKQALDTSNSNALATKSALDVSTTNANIAKSNLDGSVNTANVAKTNLDASNTIAQESLNDLTLEINQADQKIADLQNFDPNSVVQNTNILLNEMHSTNQLLTINHNLNDYPKPQLIYAENGAGLGGAGLTPAGGTNGRFNELACEVEYNDTNNMTIYVPNDYYIASPSLNKINDYKYIVTFASSTKSILIKLSV